MVASYLISIAALSFTILSFYWLYFRKGKLVVSRPRTFAALGGNSKDRVVVYLPLILYNSGAAHLVVENLELSFLEDPAHPLAFVATVDKLGTSEGRKYATPFAIAGRRACGLICEFQRPNPLAFEPKGYPLRLTFRLSGEDLWHDGLDFELYLNHDKVTIVNGNSLRVLDNG